MKVRLCGQVESKSLQFKHSTILTRFVLTLQCKVQKKHGIANDEKKGTCDKGLLAMPQKRTLKLQTSYIFMYNCEKSY